MDEASPRPSTSSGKRDSLDSSSTKLNPASLALTSAGKDEAPAASTDENSNSIRKRRWFQRGSKTGSIAGANGTEQSENDYDSHGSSGVGTSGGGQRERDKPGVDSEKQDHGIHHPQPPPQQRQQRLSQPDIIVNPPPPPPSNDDGDQPSNWGIDDDARISLS